MTQARTRATTGEMAARSIPGIGALPSGARDSITDVAGVTVGHCTLADGEVQTGVTVIRPHPGDPYRERTPAACVVLNGFGKSIGLVQIAELGIIDTPIALTNTFSVAAVAAAQIRQCIAANPEVGRSEPTLNPLVLECNDGFLNDMQRMIVGEAEYLCAWRDAGVEVDEGSVGAGRGMSAFGLKGGIGTASRVVDATHTVGALVLANFGRPEQLIYAGRSLARELAGDEVSGRAPESGSIIMIIATDAALDSRQLRRLALRAGAGLARTGSVFGHGSGDIAIAFSTAARIPASASRPMPTLALLHDSLLDPLFQAAADCTEQAIIHALARATEVTGRDGHRRRTLAQAVPALFDVRGPLDARPGNADSTRTKGRA